MKNIMILSRDQGSGIGGQAMPKFPQPALRACLRSSVVLCFVLLLGSVATSVAGEVTESDLRDALVGYIESRAPTGVEMEQWELRRGDLLPVRGELVGVKLASGAEWRAKTPIRAEVETTSGLVRTLWVTASLRRARSVVVARRTLPIGHSIGRGDVGTEIREGWRNHEDLYERAEEVIGKKVWRPVSQGSCVKSFHVRDHRDMKRGDAVVILAESAAIRVQAPGELLESGNPGDRVRVLNKASGKEVYATVVDANTVTVSF
jgi:flagella basal body P-ring formation protein FlgA